MVESHVAPPPRTESRRKTLRNLSVALVVVAAVVPACLAGRNGLEVEFHEVFVAQTAEGMLATGRVFTPQFHHEPRLNKPPLNYWLVMASDAAHGGDGVVTAAEARLPSVIAGVVFALATLWIGAAVTDLGAATLGAVMVASSMGFAAYSGSARPEMLYAASNAVGLGAMIWALRRINEQGDAARTGRLGWLAAGAFLIASLTKGPYVPLVTLASVALYLACSGQRRLMRRVLRPELTLPAMLVPFVLWYGLNYLRMPGDALASWSHELGERINPDDEPWWKWFEPYYPYKTGILIVPWVFVYPFVFLVIFSKRWRGQFGVGLLWTCLVVGQLSWQLLPGRREHYMLPLLAVVGPLMAILAVDLGRRLVAADRRWLWTALGQLTAAALAAAAVVVYVKLHPSRRPPIIGVTIMVVVSLIAGVAMQAGGRRHGLIVIPAGVAASCWVLVVALCIHGSWSRLEHEARRQLAERLSNVLMEQGELVAVDGFWAEEEFYLRRDIPIVDEPETLAQRLGTGSHVYVLSVDRRWQAPPGYVARPVEWWSDPAVRHTTDAHLFDVRAVFAQGAPRRDAQ